MREYIEKLYKELEAVTERPVTLCRAEEAGVYASTIRVLEKLEGRHGACEGMSREDAEEWAAKMENADGSTGPHWTMEQTSAVADARGIGRDVPRWAWSVAMNMMYSDYYGVAVDFGVNRPEFYAALAEAFLMDKDGPGPEAKLCAYYRGIVERGR